MIPFISRLSLAEQNEWVRLLSTMMPEEEIIAFSSFTEAQKQTVDVAIVANPDPQDLLALPNLTWVHSVWAGVEKMVMELPSPSFHIARLVDPNLAFTMSEAVLAWTLYLHRDMPQYRFQQKQKQWCQQPMVLAKERRIGVLGLGELGLVSAKRLSDNGFSVQGWSRGPKSIKGLTSHYGDDGLITLLSQSDILICLLPLTRETTHILNAEKFSYLPEGASIINFARGPLIDDKALIEKLETRHLSHAVLDVFDKEPLVDNHPYWENEYVTVLPHISAPTHPESASRIVVSNIRRYRKQGVLPTLVDLQRGY
ncbi:glyoxylate/hydroxypyruvate reductase A [Marinomonas sp. C2222]|uniref:Glyoxylate/hydroxypyruvate reductase A n=1 Tax=Marinomonas sargassi TaxID=2984494 RepID=A0ABT2YVE0_9GAMM|nr:glyoxylate/hydroxypyruvate reductase A [Marinomonas sargassi]MCV2403873.1 glyoxylate/hydroxypyruvate reductase A [Marinomonas sargassi]